MEDRRVSVFQCEQDISPKNEVRLDCFVVNGLKGALLANFQQNLQHILQRRKSPAELYHTYEPIQMHSRGLVLPAELFLRD